MGVIGDEDTVTGFLLAGVGHRTVENQNFLVVKPETTQAQIEKAFHDLVERNDIAIVVINQSIANDIRHLIRDHNQTIPTILEIPSKDQPYDPEQDSVMQRVNAMIGGAA